MTSAVLEKCLLAGFALGVCAIGVACGDSKDDGGLAGAGASAAGLSAGGASAGGPSSNGGTSAGASTMAGSSAAGNAGTGGMLAGGGAGGSSGTSTTAGTSSGGVAGSTSGGTTAGGTSGMGGSGAGAGGTGQRPYKGIGNSPCGELAQLKVAWWYNWTLDRGNCTTAEFVPMISGKSHRTPEAVTSAIGQVANGGYRTVLGFNEPNKTDQANFPMVSQVLALWPAMTSNAAIRVGSPATSADAQSWFTDFMTQATNQGLRNDFLAIHWYGWNAGSCDANAREFENYIRWAENIPGNRPIWITEFGCLNQSAPTAATVEAFFSGALAMLERHPRVERYAWYPWATNHALFANGALTPLGTIFANAPAFR